MKKTPENKGQTLKPATLGFTLIELLAVIVILAVIALIATPLIMDVISDAKKGALKSSAYGLIESGENAIAKAGLKGTTFKKAIYTFENGEVTGSPKLEFKGATPVSGNMVINKDGTTSVAFWDGQYCVIKSTGENEVTIKEDGTKENCYIDTTNAYVDTWTDWLNSSTPTYGMNSGDDETYAHVLATFPDKRCDEPIDVKARNVKWPDMTFEELYTYGQVLHLDKATGFKCNNKDITSNPQVCYDYEVQILCRNYED